MVVFESETKNVKRVKVPSGEIRVFQYGDTYICVATFYGRITGAKLISKNDIQTLENYLKDSGIWG